MDGAHTQERHIGVAKLEIACRMIWFLEKGSVLNERTALPD